MLTELCAEVRNYFCQSVYFGTYKISGGVITPLDFLKSGQYYRIVGSTFNDGVYQYGETGVAFQDETFTGAVWALNIPPAFVELSSKIEKYNQSEQAQPSAYTSESFGGYSYTKNSNGTSWKSVFATELNRWRKIR